MALTDRQIQLYTDLLFKKIAAGVSNSNPDTPYFEQPIAGRSFVDLKQIWIDSNKIPDVAQEVPNVVKYLSVVQLTPINGFPLSYWFGTQKSIIPFNYGDGISYNYILQTSAGDPIFSGTNEWYLDPDTGVLTFLDGNPPGIDQNNPPYISCYEYIGLTANDTGWGGGGGGVSTFSNGEWQDSILGFSDSLSSTGTSGAIFDIYKDYGLQELVAQLPVTNGFRIIHVGNSISNVPVYNMDTDTTTLDSVYVNDLITYWDATTNGTDNGGWIIFRPTTGTFTSGDYDETSLQRFNGVEWIIQSFEKTIPTEIKLVPEVSIAEINDWQVLTNTKLPVIPTVITTELFVNNIKTVDIEPNRAYAFGTVTTTDISGSIFNGTNVSFDVPDSSLFSLGQVLKITTPAYGFVNIVAINGNTIVVSSNVAITITGVSTIDNINIADDVLQAVKDANNNLDNVIMFWHSVNAGYHIENDDVLMFNFNVSETQ